MTLDSLFQSFQQQHVLVLGDVMIDAYLEGKVNRVSPEAPVPIVNFKKREERLGGAANVALNLLSLGAKVTMASVIGDDEEATVLRQLMVDEGIETNALVQSRDRLTTVKTRVIGNNQQLLRVDKEQTDEISTGEEDALFEAIQKVIDAGCDAIIFEDYNKGVLSSSLIERVIKLAREKKVLTTVDPKLKNFLSYKGVSLFKPNLKELSEGINRQIDVTDRDDFENAVSELNQLIDPDHLFVTMSEHGVFIQSAAGKHYIPAHRRTITDVSGAGDTVISVATLCLASGMPQETIAALANLAGGIVCESPGVVAIDAQRLLDEAKKLKVKC